MAQKVADDYVAIAKRMAELEAEKLERMNEPAIPEPAEVPEYSGLCVTSDLLGCAGQYYAGPVVDSTNVD